MISKLQRDHADVPGLSYAVADCRAMPQFMDCEFGGVLDKGTVDALLCSKDGVANVAALLSEASRVLAPGGVFLLISLGDPARRLCLLCQARYDWTVQALLLPKIAPEDQVKVDGRAVNDAARPVEALGPFDAADAETLGARGLCLLVCFFTASCGPPACLAPHTTVVCDKHAALTTTLHAKQTNHRQNAS